MTYSRASILIFLVLPVFCGCGRSATEKDNRLDSRIDSVGTPLPASDDPNDGFQTRQGGESHVDESAIDPVKRVTTASYLDDEVWLARESGADQFRSLIERVSDDFPNNGGSGLAVRGDEFSKECFELLAAYNKLKGTTSAVRWHRDLRELSLRASIADYQSKGIFSEEQADQLTSFISENGTKVNADDLNAMVSLAARGDEFAIATFTLAETTGNLTGTISAVHFHKGVGKLGLKAKIADYRSMGIFSEEQADSLTSFINENGDRVSVEDLSTTVKLASRGDDISRAALEVIDAASELGEVSSIVQFHKEIGQIRLRARIADYQSKGIFSEEQVDSLTTFISENGGRVRVEDLSTTVELAARGDELSKAVFALVEAGDEPNEANSASQFRNEIEKIRLQVRINDYRSKAFISKEQADRVISVVSGSSERVRLADLSKLVTLIARGDDYSTTANGVFLTFASGKQSDLQTDKVSAEISALNLAAQIADMVRTGVLDDSKELANLERTQGQILYDMLGTAETDGHFEIIEDAIDLAIRGDIYTEKLNRALIAFERAGKITEDLGNSINALTSDAQLHDSRSQRNSNKTP